MKKVILLITFTFFCGVSSSAKSDSNSEKPIEYFSFCGDWANWVAFNSELEGHDYWYAWYESYSDCVNNSY